MRSFRCVSLGSGRLAKRWRGFTCSTNLLAGPMRGNIADGHLGSLKTCGDLQQYVPVLIVGAGPVGLTLSILLSKLGIRSVLVERSSKLSEHPQAHFINNRTMEIFRSMDGLAEEIKALQPPLEHWRRFVYCSTLSGPILGTVDHLRPSDIGHPRSPENVAHFSQHKLLPLLHKRATSLPVDHQGSPSDIMMGHECVAFESTATGVVATISPVQDRQQAPAYLRAEYLVAADGAGSMFRRLMGIKMEGADELQELVSIHFWSKELGDRLLNWEPGMLYFIFNSHVIAVLVAHDLQSGEFVMQIPIYPPQQSLDDFPPRVCQEIIQSAAGISNLMLEVRAVKQWTMHAQVAERFVGGKGRVFLVGDAAHRFPPAGGFGMNTGVQDVHNLGWKLALVLRGHAPASLLHTYELERRPIALANTALSVANFKAAMAIPSALGLDPSSARLVHTLVSSAGGTLLSKNTQRTILESVFALGRSQVSTLFLSKYNPLAAARLAQVKKIIEEGRSLQLQFPAEDVGFRYTNGAMVAETFVEERMWEKESLGRREEYVPSSLPGGRLPHMEVLLNHGSKVSTLDLISTNREEFTLFVAPNSNGCKWAGAAIESAQKLNLFLKVVFVGPPGSAARSLEEALQQQECKQAVLVKQFATDLHLKDSETPSQHITVLQVQEIGDKSWWGLCGIAATGAILVRPDHHIAWRSKGEVTPNPVLELQSVLAKVLHLDEFENTTELSTLGSA